MCISACVHTVCACVHACVCMCIQSLHVFVNQSISLHEHIPKRCWGIPTQYILQFPIRMSVMHIYAYIFVCVYTSTNVPLLKRHNQ